MVFKVNHKELNTILKDYYSKKLALFLYGAFGIGKSFLVRDTAGEIAEQKEREFVEWNKISKEKKEEIIKNPDKYFTLIDIRLSEYDAGDMKLPNFKEGQDTYEWKIPLWAKFLTLEGSDGILFFDEINLASPLVIASVYKIIYDRVIDNSNINPNWFIVGAGNREEDMAFTQTLPAPVRDRGGEVELIVPSVEDWSLWAMKKGIDGRIITYVNWKSSSLYKVDFEDNQKFTTTRGLERLNTLIKGVENLDRVELLSKTAIGEGIASEFVGFLRIQEKLRLDEIIKNPKKIKEIPNDDSGVGIRYFLVGVVADRLKDEKIEFDKVMEISQVLDETGSVEYVALLWRMCLAYSKKFEKDLAKKNKFDNLITKYSKYLN